MVTRTERGDARRVTRHADHRGRIDGVARGHAAHLRRRARLHAEVEHGLDERHAALHAPRPGASHASPSTPDVRHVVCVQRAISCCRFRTTRWCTAKRSLLGKMPGDDWQKFANLRLLVYVSVHDARQEAVVHGWRVRATQRVEPRPCAATGNYSTTHRIAAFTISSPRSIVCIGARRHLRSISTPRASVDRLRRRQQFRDQLSNAASATDVAIVVLNFTPVPRHDYRVGVPGNPAFYRELFNSDSTYYGGSNLGNAGRCRADNTPAAGYAHSLLLTLPPLAGIVLKPERSNATTT